MKTLQIFVAICALSWTSCQRSRDCDFGWEVYNCLSRIRFDVNARFVHFMAEEKLDNSCRKFLPSAECMLELAQWCTRNREALMESIFDQHKYLMELCVKDADYRREYLKHGPCLNENKKEYPLECYDPVLAPDHQNPNDEECQGFKNVTETCDYNIGMTCGEDAATMVMRMMEPIETYYKKTCRDY